MALLWSVFIKYSSKYLISQAAQISLCPFLLQNDPWSPSVAGSELKFREASHILGACTFSTNILSFSLLRQIKIWQKVKFSLVPSWIIHNSWVPSANYMKDTDKLKMRDTWGIILSFPHSVLWIYVWSPLLSAYNDLLQILFQEEWKYNANAPAGFLEFFFYKSWYLLRHHFLRQAV